MKCCICGREIGNWGNNPWPIVKDDPKAECCDDCNIRYVIPARIKNSFFKFEKLEKDNREDW